MARDYKYRAQPRTPSKPTVAGWKWLLIILLIVGFGFFLNSLDGDNDQTKHKSSAVAVKAPVVMSTKPEIEKPSEPRFDFYTILPDKEVVITDPEVKTRTREENVGKAKVSKYLLQAGSFKDYQEADRLKARLALMGIESKIEKAQIGQVTWNRIKIGPFTRMSSVDQLRKRLKQNKIDTVVTEINR